MNRRLSSTLSALAATVLLCTVMPLVPPASGAMAVAVPTHQKVASSLLGGAGQKWVTVKHDCAAPARGHLACLALHVVPARAGAVGAKWVTEPSFATGPAGGYTPASLASAYKFNPNSGGTGQTVAIVDAYDDPYIVANLNTFDRHYGIPIEIGTTFRKVNQSGQAVTATRHPAYSRDWAGEIALDVQAVRAVCRTCRILLVEATTASSADLGAAVNTAVRMGATEVSNSYGGPETSEGGATFAGAFNHPGVVITASTGDAGWYDWDYVNYPGGTSSGMASVPAALPTVVAVAGTKLTVSSAGARTSEVLWNEDGKQDSTDYLGGASGGGCSAIYAAPAWQRSIANYARTGCGAHRAAGDVAALADPYTGFDVYDTFGGTGWVTVGGTSLSAPIVAAMWALAGGSGGVRYPAQSLYENVRYNHGRVYDVASGGNGFCGGDSVAHCRSVVRSDFDEATGNPNLLGYGKLDCSFAATGTGINVNNTQCNAVQGYDGASGVGSPATSSLFRSTRLAVRLPPPVVHALHRVTFTATATEPLAAAKVTKYAWAWGTGLKAVTTTGTAAHTYAKAGTYTVSVTVTDSLKRTATASAKVVAR